MESPHQVKERIVSLVGILQDHASADNSLNLPETPFLLDPAGIPPAHMGLSTYSGPSISTALLNSVINIRVTDRVRQELADFDKRFKADATLLKETVALLDEELKRPELVLLLAHSRRRKSAPSVSPNGRLGPKQYKKAFKAVLVNFDIHQPKYRRRTHLHFDLDITYDALMSNLEHWTSYRIIPPPIPIIHDMDKPKIQLREYSRKVRDRVNGTSGYTVADGPWRYCVKDNTPNGIKEAWCNLSDAADFEQLTKLLKRQTTSVSNMSIYIIHSQDLIALHNWNLYDSEMQRLQCNDDDGWMEFEELGHANGDGGRSNLE